MSERNKGYISLIVWIAALVLIGFAQGSLTQTDVNTWYLTLNRSPLTPPNYVFPIAWTILYAVIATCGWMIWRASSFPALLNIKRLYVLQLILNWSWTPLFFHYHLPSYALISLLVMDIAVAMIIYLAYTRMRLVSLFMMPYLGWLLFATHLNFYICRWN